MAQVSRGGWTKQVFVLENDGGKRRALEAGGFPQGPRNSLVVVLWPGLDKAVRTATAAAAGASEGVKGRREAVKFFVSQGIGSMKLEACWRMWICAGGRDGVVSPMPELLPEDLSAEVAGKRDTQNYDTYLWKTAAADAWAFVLGGSTRAIVFANAVFMVTTFAGFCRWGRTLCRTLASPSWAGLAAIGLTYGVYWRCICSI